MPVGSGSSAKALEANEGGAIVRDVSIRAVWRETGSPGSGDLDHRSVRTGRLRRGGRWNRAAVGTVLIDMAPESALRPVARRTPFTVVEWAIAIWAGIFVLVLAIAAYWDKSIRVLHLFEAVPYLAAAALAGRRNKFGYALGAAGGAVWLAVAGRGSTFIENGFQVFARTIQQGHVVRPDILIAVPAALSTAGLLCASAIGYFKLRDRKWIDSALFVAAVVAVAGYYYVIFAALTPQFLVPFRRAFTVW